MINILKRLVQSSDRLHAAAMSAYMAGLFRPHAKARARAAGKTCKFSDAAIEIIHEDRLIRLDKKHSVYAFDLIENFDFFFNAVNPVFNQGRYIVDYSVPALHHVKGYDLHPILFPSIAEPVKTTGQYLAFANLQEGSVAIDLGAYSGLTSILFRQRCGRDGKVIAVEADANNVHAARTNFEAYKRETGRHIDLLEGAIWEHNDGIAFSSEGSMGSSAASFIGDRMGDGSTLVPSYTLNTLADLFSLTRVDFIKCDIEGAENVIFRDDEFFKRFRPRIIVEVHPIKGRMTTEAVQSALSKADYNVRVVQQKGMDLPLLECWSR